MANAANEKLRVSVVVATYNRAAILPENIESVLNQDFDAFEVIYVDDGSSDPTPNVLAQWSVQASVPFRVVRTENAGPGPARNAGVAAAMGEYVLFLDDDATVPPHWIATMVDRCNAHGCDVLCGGIDAYSIEDPVAHYLHLRMQRALGRSGSKLKGAPTGNLLIRRAKFIEVGGFAEEPLPAAEDWELSYRLRQAGARIVYDPAVSIVHRFQTEIGPALQRMRTTGAVGVQLARRMHGSPFLYTLYSVGRFAVSPVWIAVHYPPKLWGLAWRMEAALVGARVMAWMRLARGKPAIPQEFD